VWMLGVPTPAELAALRRRAVGAGLGFALPSAQARVER